MSKETLSLLAIAIASIALPAVFLSVSVVPSGQQNDLDFLISGTNTCLRFLDKNVSTGYIPFKTGANEKWNLTIECTEMPTPNSWTDLYIYNGFWNGGVNYKCVSEDLHPILNHIESSQYRVRANRTFTEIFGNSTPKSYTLFLIFPPNGAGTFHVKLARVE